MPSSMIFAGLVVMWLLILVPAVARHRQEVARPSGAALSGRVLERPRRRDPELGRDPEPGRELEVDVMDVMDGVEPRTVATRSDHDEWEEQQVPADRHWERPPSRYRPGRGGFDPEAAALTARARYAFRQRVVLAMLIVALGTGIVAAVAVPEIWWPHAAVDLVLVSYLGYLRRQVRMEVSIRERRSARMVGVRRPPAADAWSDGPAPAEDVDDPDLHDQDGRDDLSWEQPERVVGIGEPLGTGPGGAAESDRDDTSADPVEGAPALPRLQPAPPPPLPIGTTLVEADEDDPGHYELDGPARPDYRRAAGE